VKSVVGGGSNHACAVLQSGRVQCWGYNIDGQLGDGTQTQQTTPFRFPTSPPWRWQGREDGIPAQSKTENFLLGGNSDGQVGDNSYTMRMVPVLIDNSGM
jgi:alpha-tubulin suppressor-like RCC1 family protein